MVDRLLEAFFAEQDGWQTPVEAAVDTLARAVHARLTSCF
jgi:hypothetical protein